ncbi:MAG TPA: hypothetical protein V6C58_19830 [Allocoleopsis sp.]
MLKKSLLLSILITLQLNTVTLAQNIRSGYGSLNVSEFIKNNQLQGLSPKQIAVKMLNESEEEGRISDEINIEYKQSNYAIITLTHNGLADDSVQGMKYKIEVRKKGNNWQIVWVGNQVKCHKGRGHQNWSSNRCS